MMPPHLRRGKRDDNFPTQHKLTVIEGGLEERLSASDAPGAAPDERLKKRAKSSRFIPDGDGILGAGEWGVVYPAHDDLLDRDVAVKVSSPSKTAQAQMSHRQLNPLDDMRKEAPMLKPSAHLMPREFQVADDGEPFIVMQRYDRFLSDVLLEATREMPEHPQERRVKKEGFRHILPSGLTIDKALGYATDLAHALADFHKNHKSAHCDIKPDNMPLDEDGHILLGDMGIATYVANNLSGPRDNMGFIYTRDLRLFFEGQNPDFKSDIYAFASVFQKLLSGKYGMQKEIDEILSKTEGGDDIRQEALRALMRKYVEVGNFFSWKKKDFYSFVDENLDESDIPKEIAEVIRDGYLGHIGHGSELVSRLNQSIKKFNENQIRSDERRKFGKELRNKALAGLGSAVGLASLALGLTWCAYVLPRPDYGMRDDMVSQVSYRKLELSDITMIVQSTHEGVDKSLFNMPTEYKNLLGYHDSEERAGSIVGKITRLWIETAADTGYDISPVDMHSRWRDIPENRGEFGISPNHFVNDMVMDLLTRSMENYAVGYSVNIEDALTSTYVGGNALVRATQAANSWNFNEYISAKDASGNYIIPEERQFFLHELLHRVSEAFPGRVYLESGSTQPESIGISLGPSQQ
ncbi:hypothetical protein JW868_01990 [Candidatus Woesearchaeota archaeon]|nr:hypothetical protein [Candidatus Woesearchaeota archaeon]